MNQDGKLDQVVKADGEEPPTGKLMLTLCALSVGAPGYRHVVIPFPPSYEAACTKALQAFAAHIPADTEAVSLRQAVQRKDGRLVWSVILEDAWDTTLEKSGEEVGVFLPGVSPENMPYNYLTLPRITVSFIVPNGSRIIRVVRSLQECKLYAKSISDYLDWGGYTMKFDERMVGSDFERKAYRQQTLPQVLSTLGNQAELFDFIISLYPNETMPIHLAPNRLS